VTFKFGLNFGLSRLYSLKPELKPILKPNFGLKPNLNWAKRFKTKLA